MATRRFRGLVAAIALAGIVVGACGTTRGEPVETDRPATIQRVPGSDVAKVKLTDQAAKRIGLATASVGTVGSALTVPYSAVLYDQAGGAWVYTNPTGLTFVRQQVTIESIDGDTARLSGGPAAGTVVATVGVAELFGAEMGVGDPE